MNLRPAEGGHVPGLNLLRMLAALSVVAFHALSTDTFSSWPILNEISKKGYLGVHLFFFISGFIIPYALYYSGYALRDLHRFMAKRIVRIEIPVIVSILIFFLIRYIFHQLAFDYMEFDPEWPRLFSHFLYINNYLGYESYIEVYWTLAIEFQLYFFIALTAPLLWSTKRYWSYLPIVALALANLYIFTPYNQAFIQYGFIFIVGLLLFQYTIRRITFAEFAGLSAVALGFIWTKIEPLSAATVVFGVLVIIFLRKDFRIPRFFGEISFSIYLVHLVFFVWVRTFLEFYELVDVHSKAFWLLMVAGSIGASWLFHRGVEKPSLRLSKKIKYSGSKREN